MTRLSFTARVGMAFVGGLALAAIATSEGKTAELKVLTSVALTSALDELAPQFERATGNKLTIDYGLIADIRKRVLEGESADVIILVAAGDGRAPKAGQVCGRPDHKCCGHRRVGGGAGGRAKPDITSVDALKRSLLAAKSIVYADPAKGGASGVYFARVLDRLGIAEQMKAKTILVPGAQAADIVAKGEAELGVAQASEIVPVAGAQLVGPLPGEYASMTVFSAGIGAGTKAPDAAKALIQFLTGPTAAPVFKSKGFEPG